MNFTQGEKYTQFIKEQIKIFESFSIHFHSAIRPDTDLVVSDYLPKTLFSVKCLIWLAPREPVTGKILATKLSELIKSYNKRNKEKRAKQSQRVLVATVFGTECL